MPLVRSSSGSQGAAAMASAGTAGSTATPRLPELEEKNSTTMTTHASSETTTVSRSRIAVRQRDHSHGTSATNGSQSAGMTETR